MVCGHPTARRAAAEATDASSAQGFQALIGSLVSDQTRYESVISQSQFRAANQRRERQGVTARMALSGLAIPAGQARGEAV
jgi:hypothetical protein